MKTIAYGDGLTLITVQNYIMNKYGLGGIMQNNAIPDRKNILL